MIDKQSDTWREVAVWAETELSQAYARIAASGLLLAQTENLRGRIALLDELLALADEPEQRVIETTEGYGFQGPDEAG